MGGDARLGRHLALPRPRAEPHDQHAAGAVRRCDRPAEGSEAARRRAGARDAQPAAAGHADRAAVPVLQRARRRRQHADGARAGRSGRGLPRLRRRRELPHLAHPRPPLEGPVRHLRGQPDDRTERVAHGSLARGPTRPLAVPLPRGHAPGRRNGRLVHRALRQDSRRRKAHMSIRIPAAVVACALLAPSSALAVSYGGTSNPAGPGKPPKHTKTLKVCKKKGKKGKRCFRKIQKAVNAAKRGDTIRVANGVYHEGVTVKGSKKDYLRLIGNTKHPRKVVIDSRGVKGTRAQNGVLIDGADAVTVNGFYARNYRGNGFCARSAIGYTFNPLTASGRKGVYGLYGFNSKGGQMLNSEAFYNKDAGFYIGQTPRQKKPRRSIARHLRAWGNAIGWSGTNMRYVTVTDSEFFNNAIGVAPNALESERFLPAEDNVITDNDIFWNNFDYYRKPAPVKPKKFGGKYDLPPGIGILMLGVRTTTVEGNRIFGNYLIGTAMVTDFAIAKPQNQKFADPIGNEIKGNDLGLGGSDLNGRDVGYDGSGRDNCIDDVLGSPTLPSDKHTFKPCPFSGSNGPLDASVLTEGLGWINDNTHEAHWIKHPHVAHRGYRVLEHWTRNYKPGGGL